MSTAQSDMPTPAMTPLGALKKYLWKARGGFLRRVHSAFFDKAYDSSHGIETTRVRQPEELAIPSVNAQFGHEYAPTPTRVFRRVLNSLDIMFDEFDFIDFGSGKARTLLLASEWPFSRIHGVEFSLELHRIAQRNLAIFGENSNRIELHHVIKLHHVGAVEFAIPDMPCVFYFYNPFEHQILSRVLDNIEASFHKQPRPMFFIYLNPEHRIVFDRRTFIRSQKRSLFALTMDWVFSPHELIVYHAYPVGTHSHYP